MIYTLFLVLILLAAVLMIGIVLIQESKGGGLSSNFSSSNAIMGVRKTTDFIEKATWGLAIAMVLFSIVCAWTAPQAEGNRSVLENTQTQAMLLPLRLLPQKKLLLHQQRNKKHFSDKQR